MTQPALEAYVAAIRVEHRELNALMRAVRETAREGAHSDWGGESSARFLAAIAALERHLLDHLRQEEDQGALEQALSFAPRFHAQVRQLAREHPALAEELRRIRLAAAGAPQEPAGWVAIAEDTEAFLRRLTTHEAAENRVLEEAFDVDLELS